MRPTKDEYYLNIAKAVSQRSTCLRAHAGAIIVINDKIVSTGYSGSYRGDTNCCDIGECERTKQNIEPGKNYELCKSVHAEMNAIINASCNIIGSTIYIYFERLDNQNNKHGGPCMMCFRAIKNARIAKIISLEIVQGKEYHYSYE